MSEQQTSALTGEISCQECRELLSNYIDRELSEGEKAAVERHLSTCAKCGSESSRMMGLKKFVQHWDGVKGSGEFRKSVIEKMARESAEMPSAQFADAAAKAKGGELNAEVETRPIPPLWILLVFAVLAALAYFIVLKLRGN